MLEVHFDQTGLKPRLGDLEQVQLRVCGRLIPSCCSVLSVSAGSPVWHTSLGWQTLGARSERHYWQIRTILVF